MPDRDDDPIEGPVRRRFSDSAWAPAMDVLVGETTAWIRLALPGSGADAVRVVARGRVITVVGRRRSRPLPEPAATLDGGALRFVWAEIVVGPFRRRVELPWTPRAEGIEVRGQDGIVEIRLVRRAEEMAGDG